MDTVDKCPICGNENFKALLEGTDYSISKEAFKIVQCSGCGLAITNPRPQEKNLGKYYNSDIYISHHSNKSGLIPWIYRKIRDIQFVNKTAIVLKHFNRNVSILDIGCGTGNFLEYCKNLGWTTTGVEPDGDARKQALQKNISVFDIDYLNNSHEAFDVISMWHVLEHVNNLNEKLEQLYRLLNTNGIVIIAVPNHKSFDALHYETHWAAYDVPRHLTHFTSDTIERLFNKHSFVLNSIHPMKYDSVYVSIKSEEYKNKKSIFNIIKGVYVGIKSNCLAKKSNDYSSLIYVFQKKST